MKKQDFMDFKFPPLDAEDFFKDKNALENLFFKSDENYKKLLEPTTYFLVGTKGSGKTMYAAYICKCETSIVADYYPIRFEDYMKFINAIHDNRIKDIDMLTIWKAILIIKIFSYIDKSELCQVFGKHKVLTTIKELQETDIIQKIVTDGFYPVNNIESQTFTDNCNINTKINIEKVRFATKTDQTKENRCTKNFDSLKYINSWGTFIDSVKKCIHKAKLIKPHYLFIDGIDIRPNKLNYEEYLSCVSSLIRASYELNQDILSDFTNGRLQIVVLTRPDILNLSGLHNLECILEDKSVVLSWNNYNANDIELSDMYNLINQILRNVEPSKKIQDVWRESFNFKIQPLGKDDLYNYPSFEYCMRLTSARPRNFIKLLSELQFQAKRDKKNNLLRFKDYLKMDTFLKHYSSYYISTIKSEMAFEYDNDNISLFLNFLKTFEKCSFTFNYFKSKIEIFTQHIQLVNIFGNAQKILDLAYRFNIICFIEREGIYRWNYREESISNPSPSLSAFSINDYSKFQFHWAVEKELGVYRGQNKFC